jgi:hypothetical protein
LRGYQYVHIQDLLKHFSLSRTLCHVEWEHTKKE